MFQGWLEIVRDDPFILSTTAQQVFYTDDLHSGHAWKVTHHYDPRHVWDIPDAPDQNINLEDLVEKF